MGITIVLADDHAIVREGLRAILEKNPNMTVIGEAGDGRAAIEMAGRLSPNVLVMDVGMPGLNGIEATRQIRRQHPSVKIVALSTYSDKRYVLRMLEAGALAYVVKAAAGQELVRAVQAASQERSYLSSEIADCLINCVKGEAGANAPGPEALGSREREVLQMLAEGLSSKEIAGELGISVRTVEAHRRNIMSKLDIHSTAALTKYAIREGLTTPEN